MMQQPSSDTVCFLLPGLVHQLGNLLLTMQGGALHLDADSIEDTRRTLLAGVQRGADSLEVLRVLLGEPIRSAAAPAELLGQLVDLIRVPLRERGMGLEVGQPAAPMPAVATAWFVTTVAEALRRWALAVPTGSSGAAGATIVQLSAGNGNGCRLQIRFDREPGSLPFPVAAAEVAAGLSQQFAREEVTIAASADGGALELVFPAAALAPPRQA